jgi:uncharacterized phage-associated protein
MKAANSVFDVSGYILQKQGTVTAMKLQKLAYYSQAWSLVWDERPLFSERIEAWANGPVVPELYSLHAGQFDLSSLPMGWGKPDSLDVEAKETVDMVLNYYGHHSSRWLSDLTHMEYPWIEARKGIPNGKRGNNEITLASMAEYYGSLPIDSPVPTDSEDIEF